MNPILAAALGLHQTDSVQPDIPLNILLLFCSANLDHGITHRVSLYSAESRSVTLELALTPSLPKPTAPLNTPSTGTYQAAHAFLFATISSYLPTHPEQHHNPKAHHGCLWKPSAYWTRSIRDNPSVNKIHLHWQNIIASSPGKHLHLVRDFSFHRAAQILFLAQPPELLATFSLCNNTLATL